MRGRLSCGEYALRCYEVGGYVECVEQGDHDVCRCVIDGVALFEQCCTWD